MKYKVVNTKELVDTLGTSCSPMTDKVNNREYFYIIGPDINGRLSHCATSTNKLGLQESVDRLNKEKL